MMKKVLALVMVLSMVGFANAGLQITMEGGKASVVGQMEFDGYYILSGGDGATLSNFALGAQAPTASITEMQGPASAFKDFGVPVPAGFEGEAWYLATNPGEAYPNGSLMNADLVLAKTQETVTWEEVIACDKYPNGTLVRTWTEVFDITMGGLSLTFATLNPDTGEIAQSGVLQALTVGDRVSVSKTFVDGECVPEPLTLSLLGLGALVLRRRS